MKKDLQLAALVGAMIATGLLVSFWRIASGPAMVELPLSEPARAAAPEVPIAEAPAAAIKHPVAASSSSLGAEGLVRAVIELVGRDAALKYLQLDELPRRLVATVDNLGHAHAPPALWPVNPAPQRFAVEELKGTPVISADNGMRYEPLVRLVEGMDVARWVDLYRQAYPLLQRGYQELGYPNGYFNDRLVAVIDLLLATPERSYPVQLQLTEVKGPIASERPWVRYEFADPALESLSAGQKILLRVGPQNQQRLKAKLAQLRRELARR